jgi:hypothetical protein
MSTLDYATADEIFESIVVAYDAVPSEQSIQFLARACLLLCCAVGDVAEVKKIIQQAQLIQSLESAP